MKELQAYVNAGVHFGTDARREQESVLNYVTGIVIPQLKEVVKERCRDIDQLHQRDIAEYHVPSFVHYTSVGALFSMLQSAAYKLKPSIRLYDSVHFNDPEEGDYLINHLAGDKHCWLKRGYGYSSHAYIASFVMPNEDNKVMNDELIFWRTYGQEGEGCSLTVDVPKSRLRRVLYGIHEAKIAVELLQPVVELLEPLASTSTNIGNILAKTFRESLEGIQYLYKNEAYSYENECRVIMCEPEISESRICFEYNESAPSTIRHYYEHKELRITEMLPSGSQITIGPCVPNYDDLSRVLQILIRKAEMPGPSIYRSQIQYQRL